MTSLFAKSRKGAEEGEKIKGKNPEGQLLEAVKRLDLQVVLRSRLAATGSGFFQGRHDAEAHGPGEVETLPTHNPADTQDSCSECLS